MPRSDLEREAEDVRRVLDRIAPPRMGGSFRWLLGATWSSNVADGISLAAGPLLVASETSNPMVVALAAVLRGAPWLLLGLYAGALADRVDRRRLIMVADALRVVVLVSLSLIIFSNRVSVAAVLVVVFLLGVAEVFADTAFQTLLPMLVDREDLGVGNSRLQGAFLLGNEIIGPPLGAFLFAAGMASPFIAQAVLVGLSVVLIARIATPKGPIRDTAGAHILQDIAEGVRWLAHNPAVRTLAIVIVTFNVTWGAAWAVLVLYALDHLGMSEVGFGLLTTSAAVGGLLSAFLYGRIERRFDLGNVMRVCLLLEVLAHLAFAVTTSGAIAMFIMFVFGAYAFVWGAVSQTVRQRATPMELQGRVGSVYLVGTIGGIVIGQAIGGAIADRWGLTAPFWFAFVGAGLTLALVWRQLPSIAHTSVK